MLQGLHEKAWNDDCTAKIVRASVELVKSRIHL